MSVRRLAIAATLAGAAVTAPSGLSTVGVGVGAFSAYCGPCDRYHGGRCDVLSGSSFSLC